MSPPVRASSAENFPRLREITTVIPARCFQRRLPRSCAHLGLSLGLLAICVAGGLALPWEVWALPAWLAYAFLTGTVAQGCWVIAHECGHGAFSGNRWIDDTIGFVLHTALLVPYFSWQRSHAVHHSRTGHMTEDETHVPLKAHTPWGQSVLAWRIRFGQVLFGMRALFMHLVVGWPLYLLVGLSSARGRTNHFWPWWPFESSLFPRHMRGRVVLSGLAVAAVVAGLVSWGIHNGSAWPVLALYGGPYLVVNAWLVLYTWLHHTDVGVPHLDDSSWSFVRGAFLTIDRNYGRLVDLLHHRIGSTHVAHHLFPKMPHYGAAEATQAIAAAFPELYIRDTTPIHQAVWRAAGDCHVVEKRDGVWKWVELKPNGTPDRAVALNEPSTCTENGDAA